jgi:hypothetical protein
MRINQILMGFSGITKNKNTSLSALSLGFCWIFQIRFRHFFLMFEMDSSKIPSASPRNGTGPPGNLFVTEVLVVARWAKHVAIHCLNTQWPMAVKPSGTLNNKYLVPSGNETWLAGTSSINRWFYLGKSSTIKIGNFPWLLICLIPGR